MPNWCMNEVTISGSRIALQSFWNDATAINNAFSFQALRPMPSELNGINSGSVWVNEEQYSYWREDDNKNVIPIDDETINNLIDKYGASDWYTWHNKYWGTKWDVAYPEIHYNGLEDGDDEYTSIEINFDTAWGPPETLYEYLVLKYPDIAFDWFYKEPNCRIAGWLGE